MARLNARDHYIRIERDQILEAIRTTKSGAICSAKEKLLRELDRKHGVNVKQQQQELYFSTDDSVFVDGVQEDKPPYILLECFEGQLDKEREQIKNIVDKTGKPARTQDGRLVIIDSRFLNMIDAVPEEGLEAWTKNYEDKINSIIDAQKELKESAKEYKPKTREDILNEVKPESCTKNRLKKIIVEYKNINKRIQKLKNSLNSTKNKQQRDDILKDIDNIELELDIMQKRYKDDIDKKISQEELDYFLKNGVFKEDNDDDYDNIFE